MCKILTDSAHAMLHAVTTTCMYIHIYIYIYMYMDDKGGWGKEVRGGISHLKNVNVFPCEGYSLSCIYILYMCFCFFLCGSVVETV